MSINLTCEEFEPVQTPSWITELILSADDNGNPMGGSEGVYKRYVLWLKFTFQETFNSVPRWNWDREPDEQSKHLAIKHEQEWQRFVHEERLRVAREAYEAALAKGTELHWGWI